MKCIKAHLEANWTFHFIWTRLADCAWMEMNLKCFINRCYNKLESGKYANSRLSSESELIQRRHSGFLQSVRLSLHLCHNLLYPHLFSVPDVFRVLTSFFFFLSVSLTWEKSPTAFWTLVHVSLWFPVLSRDLSRSSVSLPFCVSVVFLSCFQEEGVVSFCKVCATPVFYPFPEWSN